MAKDIAMWKRAGRTSARHRTYPNKMECFIHHRRDCIGLLVRCLLAPVAYATVHAFKYPFSARREVYDGVRGNARSSRNAGHASCVQMPVTRMLERSTTVAFTGVARYARDVIPRDYPAKTRRVLYARVCVRVTQYGAGAGRRRLKFFTVTACQWGRCKNARHASNVTEEFNECVPAQ